MALERELSSLLGRRVDLVERETLKPAIGKRILADVTGMRGHDHSYSDYLDDIRDATEKAARFVSGITFEQFRDNDEKVYAVIRALEVIGEAAKTSRLICGAVIPKSPEKLLPGYVIS